MATASVPLLLMSATCRPAAIHKILQSLKLIPKQITMIQGELTRPELRFIRIYMTQSLDSAEDVASLFSSSSIVADEELTPTLIYSGTRNGTAAVIAAVCTARGTPEEASNGNSTCIRRFHSVTGELDQLTRIQNFADGKFAIISCTSALGMGQNWTRVQIVVIMGAMDPSESNQMGGRAGRDRKDGLVIQFVQPKILTGKNSPSDFTPSPSMTCQDRMDAFRITPCCLRAAYSVDTL